MWLWLAAVKVELVTTKRVGFKGGDCVGHSATEPS